MASEPVGKNANGGNNSGGGAAGRVLEGSLAGKGLRIGVVVSRFNELLSERLLEGAQGALRRHGVEQVDIVRVPGAFEIPMAALQMARSGRYDALVCLGVVIRGATPHFEYVAGAAATGIARVGLETGVPASFGVVTTDTIEQAMERCGSKAGNKGWDAAVTSIEMANLLRLIEEH